MKSIKYFILLLILFIPIKVFAIGVGFSCPEKVSANKDFTCVIYGPADVFSELNAELNLPVEFNLKANNSAKYYTNSSNENNLKYVSNSNPERVIAVLTITAPNVNSDFNINFKNIKYKYNQKEDYLTKNDITLVINVSGAMTTTTTTKASTTITTATTTKNDNLPASTIPEVSNNYIVTLNANGGSEEEQSLSCAVSDGKCIVNLATANIPTKEGLLFKGWGTSKECSEGVTDNYELVNNITLYACWSTNEESLPYLKSLVVEGYDLNFDKSNYEYSINIAEDVNDLNISAEAVNKEAEIEIVKKTPFVNGINIININVKDNDKTLTYTINALREDQVINDTNNPITDIIIDGYSLNYDPNIYKYDITLKEKTDKLNITVIPLNEEIEYSITGNANLKNGSVIKVSVVYNDNLINYIINIKVNSIIDQYLNYIIAAGCILFMFIVYFIVKTQKNKSNKQGGTKIRINKKKKKNDDNKMQTDNLSNSITNNVEEPIETL